MRHHGWFSSLQAPARFAFAAGFALIAAAPAAYAAQVGQVTNPNAPLLSTPGSTGQVIENLAQDVKISISNQPTQGYYRARTASGNIGWIAATDIQVLAPGGGSAGAPAAPRAQPAAPRSSRIAGGGGGAAPNAYAGTPGDRPIATSSFALELDLAYSDQVGMGFGAGLFTRLNDARSWHTFELGLQGAFYAFNATTPAEGTASFRYWVGRDGIELGAEIFVGALMLLNTSGFTAAQLATISTTSLIYGPGLNFSIGVSKGIRFYGGFREDFSNTHGRYGRGGLVFYL